MSIFSALQELSVLSQAILPTMTDPKVPRTEKRKTLCVMVDGLSEKTFKSKYIAKQIMGIINMKEDVCKEYGSTEAQVDGICGWCPRMKEHRDLLVKEVTRHRKQYGLTI